MADTFDLNELVHRVIAFSDHADPGSATAEVLAQIPDESVRDALELTLREYVRQRFPRLSRMSDPAENETMVPSGRPVNASWKRDAIREGWQRVLRDRVHVGPDSSAWKFLGDCTTQDLAYAASERRSLAAGMVVAAQQYEHLANLLTLHSVTAVKDLDSGVLAGVLDGA